MDDDGTEMRPRGRRWRRLGAVVTVLLVAALVVGWLARKPIARGFVDRELARRGVPARYTISSFGTGGQRLTDVVIGDPAHPDLVADWIELSTRIGFGDPEVTGFAAGHVRMRARIVNGRLSLGAIDRLLPAGGGGGSFALPKLTARLEDLRLRIESPAGVAGVRLSGAGRLDDGFAGRAAIVAPALTAGGCAVSGLTAAVSVRVKERRPTLDGPVRAAGAECAGGRATAMGADVVATFGTALDRWTGSARLVAGAVAGGGVTARSLDGRVTFGGDAAGTAGDVDIATAGLTSTVGTASAATARGRYRVGRAAVAFVGTLDARHAALVPAAISAIAPLRSAGAGTPVNPLVRRAIDAGVLASRDFAATAQVDADRAGVRVRSLAIIAATGARVSLSGSALRFGEVTIGGRLAMAGGGVPEVSATLSQRADGAIEGRAVVQPYAADGARLALAPVSFRAGGSGATTVNTVATLSGPLGDGRIDGLRLPVDARWSAGVLAVAPGCTPIEWRRLAISGLVLDAARLRLCATGSALVRVGDRIEGGGQIVATRLTGRLGGTPLTLAVDGGSVALAGQRFALTRLAARLGTDDRMSRLDVAGFDGRFAEGMVAGTFTGGGGQIGKVPLLLSDAAGDWRLAGGRLTIDARMQVADAAVAPRFKPLVGEGVTLSLVGNAIHAAGMLLAPKTGARIADVAIDHDLAAGSGHARLEVPGIVFAPKGLQPDDLTSLTFGVIAAVTGTVSGHGDVAWSPAGVSSTGSFGTDRADFAAAFGPVSGLATRVTFTDLLGLVSAPGQIATIASLNPGVPVENGVVRFALVGEQRVQVQDGRWPFAGGTLALEPTLLDFGADRQRQLTFRVTGVDAAQFLQQFDFDNLSATGTFDGLLPMIFDSNGGRIENGHLRARTGGSIAYLGTITQKDVGFWGNLAFQALKALDYKALDLTMNGPLAGEMLTQIRFAGVSQGKGTKTNFLIRRLAKLPFVFNVTVRAPFRQLIDSARSFYDPRRLIEQNLPALQEEQRKRDARPSPSPVQPPESEKRP